MASNKENQQSVKSDFDSFTVNELKAFLRDRGEYVSGPKRELVKRAKGTEFLKKRPLSEIRIDDDNKGEKRNLDRFESPLGEKLPDPRMLKDGWTYITDIPTFTKNEVYNYLVLNKNRTLDSDSNNAKRQLKAKVFYEDRHVHSLQYHALKKDCSHGYVKAKVIPSLPTQNEKLKPDYNVWVSLAKVSGHVHAAGCDCSAGDGESCNHVAAVLHALVDVAHAKHDGLDASTSKECKWNQPRKRKPSPQKAEDLQFKKHKWEETELPKSKKKLESTFPEKPVKPVNVERFSQKLSKCAPHAAWLLTCETENTVVEKIQEVLVPELHTINFNFTDNCDLAKEDQFFRSYFENLSVDPEDCVRIEERTRAQCKSKAWHVARSGRVTASQVGAVCKRDKSKSATEPTSLVKTVCGYYSFDNKYVKWGRDHEPAAKKQYKRTMRKKFKDLEVSSSGLIVHSEQPHLGASPDGIIKIGGNRVGVLEVKCPYKWRFLDLASAAKDPQFCCKHENGSLKLKRSHIYYYQVQAQMALSATPWCDFVMWTLKDFHVERIEYDELFWRNCVQLVNEFYVQFIIPELFTSRVKRGKPLY